MANAHIVFAGAMDAETPVIAAQPLVAQRIVSGASPTLSSISAPAIPAGRNRIVCSITAQGGDIWASIGASPVAAVGSGWLIPSGTTREFGFISTGWQVSVLDA